MKKNIFIIVLLIALLGTVIYVVADGKNMTAYYEDIKVMLNGNEQKLTTEAGEEIEPFIVNDSVYVPLRGVSQVFGKNVQWDGTNKTVILSDYKYNTGGTISVLGDSISAGVGCTYCWPDYVGWGTGITMESKPISGTTISTTKAQSFLERSNVFSKDTRMIMVMGGTNDAIDNVSIGTADSTDTNTVYGALKELMFRLKYNYPKAVVVFCTPIKENDWKVNLENVCNAIKNTAKIYNIPVIDVYNSEECNFTSKPDCMYDNIHPNDKGQKIISDYICSELKRLGLNNK